MLKTLLHSFYLILFCCVNRRDLQRATTMLEMVKRREKTKREQLHLSIEIFEKRVNLRDFNGAILSELSTTLKNTRFVKYTGTFPYFIITYNF